MAALYSGNQGGMKPTAVISARIVWPMIVPCIGRGPHPGWKVGPKCTLGSGELKVRGGVNPQVSEPIGIQALAHHIRKVLKDRSQSQGRFLLAHPE